MSPASLKKKLETFIRSPSSPQHRSKLEVPSHHSIGSASSVHQGGKNGSPVARTSSSPVGKTASLPVAGNGASSSGKPLSANVTVNISMPSGSGHNVVAPWEDDCDEATADDDGEREETVTSHNVVAPWEDYAGDAVDCRRMAPSLNVSE